ncbi:MAG: beta-propeller fold lactonase family protein [Planctomycetota bacterium]
MQIRTFIPLVMLAVVMAPTLHAQSVEPAIFVTNNVGDSITSLTINADGSLAFVGTTVTGEGPQAISLSPTGRFLAVGHGTISSTTEELRIFEVNADATLTPLLTTLVPDSPLDALWLSDSILAVPETDLGDSTIRTYAFDDSAITLSQVDVEAVGGFATSVTASADGARLFTNDSFSGTITSMAVDASGQVTLVDTVSQGSLFATDVNLTNDGQFLYGSGGISGGGNALVAYAVAADGSLSVVAGSPFTSPGESPKVTDVTGDDAILVAGHGTDATIHSFLRDTMTGALTATNFSFDVGSQGTLGDLTVMDDLMFVTDESTVGDGVAGVYSFRIHPDGSFSQLGPIVDTQGTRPEYIAAWGGQSLTCDFDGNETCDLDDLNQMLAIGPIAAGVPAAGGNAGFDLDGNGVVDLDDLQAWLAAAADENGLATAYKPGDANLDGTVDGNDFVLWNASKFSASLRWDNGDFNGDGVVDGNDFVLWNASKFTSSDTLAVPEPTGLAGCLLGVALWWRRRLG